MKSNIDTKYIRTTASFLDLFHFVDFGGSEDLPPGAKEPTIKEEQDNEKNSDQVDRWIDR